jgi:hypothetical protein
VDASAEKVGIGVSTPSYKLDVNGDIRAVNNIYGDLNAQFANYTSCGPNSPGTYRLRVDSEFSNLRLDASNTLSMAKFIAKLIFSGISGPGTNETYIDFEDSGGRVGRIHSGVVYATFTGGHTGQTIEDLAKWKHGMIVSSTGELIENQQTKANISRALVKIRLSNGKKDKAVVGVFTGYQEEHNDSGFDKEKPSIDYNALGEGMILVTNSGGDLEIGDYICASATSGYGEKQDDDMLHNYTVAKATVAVKWDNVEGENGFKSKLMACTYHAG